MVGAFYCVAAVRFQVSNLQHNKRSGAFCWLAQTSLLVGGQLTLLLTLFALKFSLGDDIPATHYLTMVDALFIAVSVMVVFALVWGIYVIYLFQSGRVERGHKFEHRSNLIFLLLLGLVFLAWVASYLLPVSH